MCLVFPWPSYSSFTMVVGAKRDLSRILSIAPSSLLIKPHRNQIAPSADRVAPGIGFLEMILSRFFLPPPFNFPLRFCFIRDATVMKPLPLGVGGPSLIVFPPPQPLRIRVPPLASGPPRPCPSLFTASPLWLCPRLVFFSLPISFSSYPLSVSSDAEIPIG